MQKALSILRGVERILLVTIFLAMVGLYFVNVVVRASGSMLASDLAWIEEAVRLMNIYLVFLALGLALEYGRHVAVDTWRDGIGRALHLPVRRIIDATGLVFCVYLVWLGYKMSGFVFATDQRSPTLGLPMGWIYVAPMIGFSLLALRFLLSLLGGIDRFDTQAADEA
ncbi:TRAP transporter small permease subunit [Nitratireductor sp. CAU 1489]|uniref:TRAP transporter small permease protein n=1 Tax=Nitratireductor arenosus TaxID=2682096 RepID=A0A844QHF8_9HYPH|nr:TRAP transporter small permease subunit [Nitratireductor arenosus]MVA98597.1 TRAP transporter small permease subunit [Nitratireductor arenosus]